MTLFYQASPDLAVTVIYSFPVPMVRAEIPGGKCLTPKIIKCQTCFLLQGRWNFPARRMQFRVSARPTHRLQAPIG